MMNSSQANLVNSNLSKENKIELQTYESPLKKENSDSMYFGISRKQENLLWDRANSLQKKKKKNHHEHHQAPKGEVS